MTQAELVTSIGNTLTALDTLLMGNELNNDKAKWQQVFALRKHLNEQQLSLVQAQLQADDVDFATYTGIIAVATRKLNDEIASMKSIDAIINTVAQISANVDDVLKLV